MASKEFDKLSVEKLEETLKDRRLELMKLRAKKALGTAEKPTAERALRKDIARILTVLNSKVKKGG